MAVAIYDGSVAATTSAAALLSVTGDAITEVLVQNDPGNSANLKVGTSTSQSYLLRPGDSVSIPASDLNQVYVTAVSGTVTTNYTAHNAPFSAGLSPRLMVTASPAAGQTLTVLNALATFTPQVTIASGANVVWDGISLQATTVTLTGVTGVTNVNGFNAVSLYRPTITDASAVTVTNAATLMVQNSPLAAGSVTLTNTYALWVIAGITRLAGGAVILGANSTINSSSNFNVNICDGTSTGAVTIGNAANAGAVSIQSHAASSFQATAAGLTLGTLTSGTVAVTSAGALNATSAAASTWTHSGGAWLLTSASQNISLVTTTAGNIVFTSAAFLTATSVGNSSWAVTSGNLALSTVTSGTLSLLSAAALTINATSGPVQLQSAIALPASGSTTCGITISSTANIGLFAGTGAPTFSAANGSIYIRYDGTAATPTLLYYNSSGASSAGTTWTALVTP